jgi:formimidoylglutamate deiminase
MPKLFFSDALLPDGWAKDVAIDIVDGWIASVEKGASAEGRERVEGIALPGMPNVHSHAFQYAMAGLTEVRGPGEDSFWSWRELMYHFLDVLTPDDVEAIATQAYAEMLEAGFTSVGEFHYLHHAPDGRPYDNIAEMGERIAAAAAKTGIGLTLLPSLYAYGGFGGAPPTPGQRRFLNDIDSFLRLVEKSKEAIRGLPNANIGIAPHSLRAVSPEMLREVTAAFPDVPVHIHAAEQVKEVEDCLAWSGQRPVEWLLDNAGVDERWCIIHATHMTEDETERLAKSGAVVGLCPITEANLGDGIFNGVEYRRAGGRFAIGTDSNVEITAPGELRQLEYSQRLKHRVRNAMALKEGESVGRVLYETCALSGAQALGRNIGALAAGMSGDVIVLGVNHLRTGPVGDSVLDRLSFLSRAQEIRRVYTTGLEVAPAGAATGKRQLPPYRAAAD